MLTANLDGQTQIARDSSGRKDGSVVNLQMAQEPSRSALMCSSIPPRLHHTDHHRLRSDGDASIRPGLQCSAAPHREQAALLSGLLVAQIGPFTALPPIKTAVSCHRCIVSRPAHHFSSRGNRWPGGRCKLALLSSVRPLLRVESAEPGRAASQRQSASRVGSVRR